MDRHHRGAPWRAVAVAVTAGALLAAGAAPLPAVAQEAAVTLSAAPATISYGDATTLAGQTSSAGAGEVVFIIDRYGNELQRATTDASGRYSVTLAPKETTSVQARWGAASSEFVTVSVRAIAGATLRRVRLFDRALVKGRVRPAIEGARASVRLLRKGRTVATRFVSVHDDGRFKARFGIARPGRYAARVVYSPPKHLPGRARTKAATTPLPRLRVGSKGRFVNLLERRLDRLNYYLTGIDKRYDARTATAVLAFRKVQGQARIGTVDGSTWKALARPKVPKPRSRARFYIEVDQTKQVMYTIDDRKITNILHVSTGANNATRDGTFRIYKKGGYGGQYYPVYFDGARAFHGWSDVPPQGASAGCIRLPFWAIRYFYYNKLLIGTKVVIHH